MPEARTPLDTATDELDEALTRLAATGPEYWGGLANHGPMAVEALHHLGRADAVRPWTDRYLGRLEPAPAPGRALSDDEWPGALGRADRYPDWLARFTADLDAQPWPDVVTWWAPALVPGLWGSAGHGALRVAHAVRALDRADTPARRAELAFGLAYWASVAEELPGDTRLAGPLPLDVAMAGVHALPVPELSGFLITERVAQLTTAAALPAAIDALGPVTLSELTAAFARTYLANADHGAIAFTHAITAPAALRSLGLLLPVADQPRALGAAWRCAAVLLGAFGANGTGARVDVEDAAALDPEDLVDRAVASGDEHAIKLTAACLGEHALVADPAYLAVALDVGGRLRA
jgi:hypothetical protein